jgi:C4-dicarboxylate-specific signal transduction histidine kinase
LVLVDTSGNIVANGNTQEFSSVNTNVSDSQWFTSAMRTKSGSEFGFQTVHKSPLVNNNLALVYSCAVREGGDTKGKIIGVLGVIFKWESLSQTIIQHTPIGEEEKVNTRVCIVDDDGLILADSEKKNYLFSEYEGAECCIAHALSPGFEGYYTGWHSLIIQKLGNISKKSH